jgi:hypothetical protein
MKNLLRIALLLFAFSLPFYVYSQDKNKDTKRVNMRKRDSSVLAKGSEEAQDKERKGPASNKTFNINGQIASDYDFAPKDIENILNISNTIYRDANIKSGYYYYLPASYNLSWSEKTGQYDFNVKYGTAGEEGLGETTITAILKPRLSRKELKLVKELLLQNLKGKPEAAYGIKEILPMPLAKSSGIDFTNLGQFDVEDRDISIRAPSDLTDPIYISFSTDKIDFFMEMLFNDIGLYGNVLIYPSGEGWTGPVPRPFNLKIDDPKTFGSFQLSAASWRKGWQNKADFPVILSNFHVMRKETDGKVKIYTWKVGDKEVPEKAKVKFDAGLVPTWIDRDPTILKIWMDYTIMPCSGCNRIVKEKIIGGTAGSRVKNIEFTILNPIEFTGAELIKINIRSYQADPNGLAKITLPTLNITHDGQTLSGGRLYFDVGEEAQFEYFIKVYMADGTLYKADRWVQSKDLEVVLGSGLIKELISDFR